MQNLTIKDIAKLCGVGKSTVSRVINHDPNVKASTREKVLAIIAEQQFSPSKSARAMRGYHHQVIGIMVTRLDSYAENQAVRAMLPILYQQGIDAMIVESQFNHQQVKTHLKMLQSRQVDGLITFAFSDLDTTLFAPWQDKALFMARIINRFPSICYDDVGAVYQVLNYLYTVKQHRNIGFLGVQLTDLTTGKLRYQAYQQFCQQHQLACHAQLGDLDSQSGYLLASQLLATNPTAIVCATDSLALGLGKYLQENQIHTVEVCSIGYSELLKFLYPAILSVDLGFYASGQIAATSLLRLLAGEDIPQHTIISSKMSSQHVC
ncbi:trehalose operon repressor TreR [Utexia brackfieldae]|uniref:trehalose operon repressor TreR n=1 Tax=Utexia brackfieldae TaxID=3074108 RepID=UPI00370DCC2B